MSIAGAYREVSLVLIPTELLSLPTTIVTTMTTEISGTLIVMTTMQRSTPMPREIWYDGVDRNCDGLSDFDQDGDGDDSMQHGGVDCDDENPLINTSASDANLDGVDNDCDGQIDEDAQGGDLDGDGVDVFNGDCDDDDSTVYPGATEIWYDGVDQDCAGDSDFDQDGDGFDSTNMAEQTAMTPMAQLWTVSYGT